MFAVRWVVECLLLCVCARTWSCGAVAVAEAECEGEYEGGKAYLAPRYLLYDVNPAEGFNLRRDVYMRLAVLVRVGAGAELAGWQLVLPPWSGLQHWQPQPPSPPVPWSAFFHLPSMQRYARVVEMHQLLHQKKLTSLDVTVVLQHFKEAFTDSWSWEEKWEFEGCNNNGSLPYSRIGDSFRGHYWGYTNISSKDLFCVSFQGQASSVRQILDSVDRRSVMIDRAEIVLHDGFGSAEYWRCRRSMRFADDLVSAAARFREQSLDSTDRRDGTTRPPRWEDETLHRSAVGGNYLGVHLRRRDFETGRKEEIPTLDQAARQISDTLDRLELTTVFIATDAPSTFVEALRGKLVNYKVLQYEASLEDERRFKAGGLAIIDQIICSHARYFLGSYESTFSFRIQEEREILGFPVESTFNRLCGSVSPCSQPTRWLITH